MRYFLVGFLAVTAWTGVASADEPRPAAPILYDGVSYEQALAQFHSDLSPGKRVTPLKVLIGFAVRDHHADDVARLLMQECRTIPLQIIGGFDTKEAILGQLQQMWFSMELLNGKHEDSTGFSADDWRYWKTISHGLSRLALTQRKVFQQTYDDPQSLLSMQIMARAAVQHAEILAASAEEIRTLLFNKPMATDSALPAISQ